MAQEKLLKKKCVFGHLSLGGFGHTQLWLCLGVGGAFTSAQLSSFLSVFLAIMVDYSSWVVLDCVEAIFKPYLMVQVENFFNQNNPY